jgi:hypothetical protein
MWGERGAGKIWGKEMKRRKIINVGSLSPINFGRFGEVAGMNREGEREANMGLRWHV